MKLGFGRRRVVSREIDFSGHPRGGCRPLVRLLFDDGFRQLLHAAIFWM